MTSKEQSAKRERAGRSDKLPHVVLETPSPTVPHAQTLHPQTSHVQTSHDQTSHDQTSHDLSGSDQKTLEHALVLARDQWEQTFDSVPDMVAILDKEHRIVRLNRAMRERLGVPAEGKGDRLCYHFLHGTLLPPGSCPHALTMADGERHTIEFHDERLNADFVVTTSPLLDSGGALVGSVHIARDITREKRTARALEQRVRERTEELARTVSTLQAEIAERERAEGSLRRLNRLYAVLSEVDQAIVRARDRQALFADCCRIAVAHGGFVLARVGLLDPQTGCIVTAAASGVTAYLDDIQVDCEMREGPTAISIREGSYCICNDFQEDPLTVFWHEQGKAHGIRASASIALKEQGRVIGALTLYAGEANFFDRQLVALLQQLAAEVSFALENFLREARRREAEHALRQETLERLRAVEAMREQERLLIQQSRLAALGDMIGNIAHQWRQPLNTVGLMIQELTMCYDYGEFSREYLDSTVENAMRVLQHMSQTIDDFRNFFRPEKEKVPFRARAVIDKAVSIVEASLKAQRITLEVTGEADPLITGYPNEYSQVILNILLNARDAFSARPTPTPRIEVRVGEEGGRSQVLIADNAGGIPEEVLERIFDPYFTTKGPDQGTGVGLYMSKVIMEKNMNGRLSARNRDEGAEFTIEV